MKIPLIPMHKKQKFEIKYIFPDPVENYFTFTFISTNNCKHKKLKVSIYNAVGVIIILYRFDDLVSHAQYTIKTGNLNNGLYHVEFCLDDKKIVRKIEVVKRVLENNLAKSCY